MNAHALIAELRRLVEEARSMPMSASAVVNRAELLDLLAQLDTAVDVEIADAKQVVADKDDVVAEGRREAEQLLHEARLERDRLVSDTEVYRLAQRQADDLLVEARTEAEGLRREADEYVDGRFAEFEITLDRTLETIRRGRERLAGRSELDTLGDADGDGPRLPAHLEG